MAHSSDVASFASLLAGHPVVLAPMDDVSDAPFRRLCRRLGAGVCVTEFVRAEQLIHGSRAARRRIRLEDDDRRASASRTIHMVCGCSPA